MCVCVRARVCVCVWMWLCGCGYVHLHTRKQFCMHPLISLLNLFKHIQSTLFGICLSSVISDLTMFTFNGSLHACSPRLITFMDLTNVLSDHIVYYTQMRSDTEAYEVPLIFVCPHNALIDVPQFKGTVCGPATLVLVMCCVCLWLGALTLTPIHGC